MKKEELLKKIGGLELQVKTLEEFQIEQLKELAKAFNWKKPTRSYGSYDEGEAKLPTWGEVFVEIGRLLAKQKYIENMERIDGFDFRLGDIEANVRNILKNKIND
ncbi:MAG: hypothetical protein WC648_01085 [Candidatus Paceibacterota bacterium]|jgi:hypothetical protein